MYGQVFEIFKSYYMKNKWLVYGIDPAPKKGLSVYDGCGFDHIPIEDASSYLEEIGKKGKNVLVCWDSPLTAPSFSSTAKIEGSVFTQRKIESFFSRKNWKPPKGISVRGYAGCPHWTISRFLLGLPQIGKFDSTHLPFNLQTSNIEKPKSGINVVEVHPALAVWLALRDNRKIKPDGWAYKDKKEKSSFEKILTELKKTELFSDALEGFAPKTVDDDGLDARVAYALGTAWLNNAHNVKILGDRDSGGFLLPMIDKIEDEWAKFQI